MSSHRLMGALPVELELRHLRTICAIAETGSLTKAAATLGLTQSALTAQLQRIEREVGGQLFERDHHGSTPTKLGEFVLSRAQATLLSMEELRRSVARQPTGAAQVLQLGGAMGSISVGLAHRLTEHFVGADIRLHMEYSPRLLQDLLVSGRLDAMTTVDYPDYEMSAAPNISMALIVNEPVFVALPVDHRLADAEEVELAELADEVWALTLPDGAGWPGCFHAACQRAGFTAQVPYNISSRNPIRDLVASGKAVAPCQAVITAGDDVVVKPLAGTPIMMRHLLACRRDGPLIDHMPEVLRLAQEAYWAYAVRAPHYLAWCSSRDML